MTLQDRGILICGFDAARSTAEIKLDGFEAGGPAKVQTLSSPNLSDQNSAENPEQVIPKENTIEASQTFEYTFPRSSVAVIELDRSGK